MLDLPDNSVREDGWGARGRMKDAPSTDVVVHNGKALSTFWQCGDVYQLDPTTLADEGKAAGPRTSRARPACRPTRSSTSARASCSCSATARRPRTSTTASWPDR